MKSRITAIMGCTLGLALASYAQQSQSSQTSTGQASPGQSASSSESGSEQPWQKANKSEFFRASDVIGKNTQTQDGQKLGAIKDFVFNQQGELFVLVDVGQGKQAAVPWQVFNAHTAKGEQAVMIKSTAQAIRSAPAVTKDQWGSLNSPTFTKGIYAYYKIQPTSGSQSQTSSDPSTSSSDASAAGASESTGESETDQGSSSSVPASGTTTNSVSGSTTNSSSGASDSP